METNQDSPRLIQKFTIYVDITQGKDEWDEDIFSLEDRLREDLLDNLINFDKARYVLRSEVVSERAFDTQWRRAFALS